MVLVLASGCHLAVSLLLESTQLETANGLALARSAQAISAAEAVLAVARLRLDGSLAFPAGSCGAGLCANLRAPAVATYEWNGGNVHQAAGGGGGNGYWIESLGSVTAGQTEDCPGSTGGCEYVRVIASAAPDGVRRTLEAVYRIRRSAGLPPGVTRLGWRQSKAP